MDWFLYSPGALKVLYTTHLIHTSTFFLHLSAFKQSRFSIWLNDTLQANWAAGNCTIISRWPALPPRVYYACLLVTVCKRLGTEETLLFWERNIVAPLIDYSSCSTVLGLFSHVFHFKIHQMFSVGSQMPLIQGHAAGRDAVCGFTEKCKPFPEAILWMVHMRWRLFW